MESSAAASNALLPPSTTKPPPGAAAASSEEHLLIKYKLTYDRRALSLICARTCQEINGAKAQHQADTGTSRRTERDTYIQVDNTWRKRKKETFSMQRLREMKG